MAIGIVDHKYQQVTRLPNQPSAKGQRWWINTPIPSLLKGRNCEAFSTPASGVNWGASNSSHHGGSCLDDATFFPVSLLTPCSVFPGPPPNKTTHTRTLISRSASGTDLNKTASVHILKGRQHTRPRSAQVPDESWRGGVRDTKSPGGENRVYASSHGLLSEPFLEAAPTNRSWVMSTDPVLCTYGGTSRGNLRNAGGSGWSPGAVMMQWGDQHSITTPACWGLRQPKLRIALNSQVHLNGHGPSNTFQTLNSFS